MLKIKVDAAIADFSLDDAIEPTMQYAQDIEQFTWQLQYNKYSFVANQKWWGIELSNISYTANMYDEGETFFTVKKNINGTEIMRVEGFEGAVDRIIESSGDVQVIMTGDLPATAGEYWEVIRAGDSRGAGDFGADYSLQGIKVVDNGEVLGSAQLSDNGFFVKYGDFTMSVKFGAAHNLDFFEMFELVDTFGVNDDTTDAGLLGMANGTDDIRVVVKDGGKKILQIKGDANDVGTAKSSITYNGDNQSNSFSASAGKDKLKGRGGNDALFGEEGNDKILGGGGDDDLYGEEGKDRIIGGAQEDWIFGGEGDDYLAGGAGADDFFFALGDGADYIRDFGKKGDDLLHLNGNVTAYNYDVASLIDINGVDMGDYVVLDFGAGDSITFNGVSDLSDLEGHIVVDDFYY